MKFISSAFRSIVKKPFLVLYIALVMLPLLYFSEKLSLLRYFSGEQGLGSLNILDTYLLILRLSVKYLSSVKNISLIFLSMAVLSIISGIVAGAFFSGYFYMLHKTVNSYKPKKNDFIAGISKYFFGIFRVTSISLLLTSIVVSVISFIFVPSVVTLNALLAGKAELFFILVLFTIVTIFVLFFSFTFYRIYLLYWLPAVISFKKNSFRAGRYVANNNFWRSMVVIIIFDIIFIGSRVLYFIKFNASGAMRADASLFILNWLFMTFFTYLFIYYLFYSFKNSKDQSI